MNPSVALRAIHSIAHATSRSDVKHASAVQPPVPPLNVHAISRVYPAIPSHTHRCAVISSTRKNKKNIVANNDIGFVFVRVCVVVAHPYNMPNVYDIHTNVSEKNSNSTNSNDDVAYPYCHM